MTTKIEEEHRKEIDITLGNLKTHAESCSKAIFEDAFVLGRHFEELGKNDLDIIYSAAHTFHKICHYVKT